MPLTRLLRADDAPRIAELVLRNREFHRPWSPRRPERWFTAAGQRAAVAASIGYWLDQADHAASGVGRGADLTALSRR